MEKNEFETEKIKAETKSIIVKKNIDIVKGSLLIIGSVILFIVIQQPDSVLNRQISKETISRERAKLILDLTKNSNYNK
ncbi:hypothetical protein [Psychroflexus sp. MES1-P1E]|uniref:hypothetical protein n=1 Tax=Psychroflexus sp. MES1-P1E TaxID=2058320 RepID=UPI000C7B670C|nr:hypothetical protein [Psychroflexus sp. MES1-P1E]PKG42717.1 hypothetical protein CXF67_08810 [Psychroflexus sp. MES1-P1E]